MSRLSGNNLQRFEELCISYNRKTGRRITFLSTTKSNGYELSVLLRNVYSEYIKKINYGFTYKDFTLIAKDAAAGKAIYEDISAADKAFKEAHGYEVVTELPLTGVATGEEPLLQQEHRRLNSNAMYVVIGVAAVFLIVSLWEKR